jgi:hypothetical protein
MDDRVHLFGIRHHGPGSAASLLAALDAVQPAAVLIEGPPEADKLIPYALAPGMQPPLALLAYAADAPECSVFFPFANFSPEWQAMLWALRHGCPVRFIDWPAALSLATKRTTRNPVPKIEDEDALELQPDATVPTPPLYLDPLDRLAEVSGYADGEALWNALVESSSAGREVFTAIEQAMTVLRAATDRYQDRPFVALREARREAHMRLEIRKALKEHEGQIAVVVGAWHVPALRQKIAANEDRATLKDLPRVKVEISWVPWTETRLAAASGYGAGVTSPGWYGHLWQLFEGAPNRAAPEFFASSWQAKVAALLRAQGHAAATASVIEAARLALTLAAMRGQPMPGLDDMREATRAVLCHGDETPFRLIETRLIIGEAVGVLDESVPQMPLAADLAAWQRKLRLKPEALEQDIALDLRSDAGFAKSVLLHRLDLMDVAWGRLIDAGAGRGTFREIWRLVWSPELSVKLAEALVHGITIEQAAAGAAIARMTATATIASLADLVHRCLLSDLPETAERCIDRLQAAAVNAVDIASLMRALPPLVAILRYGTARKMPREALSALAKALAVEVNAGIALACSNLDDAAAEDMRQAAAEFDTALTLLGDDHLSEEWTCQLKRLAESAAVVPLIAGLALRRLYDRSASDTGTVTAAFMRALSPTQSPKAVGSWLDGFLGSNAEVMLQDSVLFGLVDSWIEVQQEADFIEILPMLRRAFGGFGATQRRRFLAEVDKGQKAERLLPAGASATADNPGFQKALPLLFTILGLPAKPGPASRE